MKLLDRKKIKKTTAPNKEGAIYVRPMFATIFFGPFDTVDDLCEAAKDEWFADILFYETCSYIYGKSNLPECFVSGFEQVPSEAAEKVMDIVKKTLKI